jgi:hypothetical protein
MPKNAIDYSNTIIYKIYCLDETIIDTYVGHTTNFLKRKYQHKWTCINGNNSLKLYKTIQDNGGWENWNMVEIAVYHCNSPTEARIKEQEHKDLLKASLNAVKPFRTQEEIDTYYSKGSEWYTKNQERSKKRYLIMCQKIEDLENENMKLKEELIKIKSIVKY